jgi:hypothetical protein
MKILLYYLYFVQTYSDQTPSSFPKQVLLMQRKSRTEATPASARWLYRAIELIQNLRGKRTLFQERGQSNQLAFPQLGQKWPLPIFIPQNLQLEGIPMNCSMISNTSIDCALGRICERTKVVVFLRINASKPK